MTKVETAKWYFTVECEKCGRGLAFQETTEDDTIPVALPNEFPITCHVCGHTASYRPEQVQRSQAQYKQ